MTTAQKSAAKKVAPNKSVIGKAVLDTLNKGEVPQVIPKDEGKTADKEANKFLTEISKGACVTAMTKAFGFGKQALHIEAAIALTIFATSKEGVSKATKQLVMDVYKAAGFNADPTGEDYKTCHRRMNTFAKLYNKWGAPMVQEHMDGFKEGRAIDALRQFITTEYDFKGLNDFIAEATGSKPSQTNTAAYRKAAAAKAVAATVLPAPTAAPAPVELPEEVIAASVAGAAPTAADTAVMAQIGEAVAERKAAEPKTGRRSLDRGVIMMAGELQLNIPYGTTGKDIQALFAKLSILASTVRNDTVIDEKFDKFSDVPVQETH
jgi:hypothetical protein